jgi:hypothetical protein
MVISLAWSGQKKTQVEAEKEAQLAFGNMNSIDLFNVAENAIKEMRKF